MEAENYCLRVKESKNKEACNSQITNNLYNFTFITRIFSRKNSDEKRGELLAEKLKAIDVKEFFLASGGKQRCNLRRPHVAPLTRIGSTRELERPNEKIISISLNP